jgi:hypothetical protein
MATRCVVWESRPRRRHATASARRSSATSRNSTWSVSGSVRLRPCATAPARRLKHLGVPGPHNPSIVAWNMAAAVGDVGGDQRDGAVLVTGNSVREALVDQSFHLMGWCLGDSRTTGDPEPAAAVPDLGRFSGSAPRSGNGRGRAREPDSASERGTGVRSVPSLGRFSGSASLVDSGGGPQPGRQKNRRALSGAGAVIGPCGSPPGQHPPCDTEIQKPDATGY